MAFARRFVRGWLGAGLVGLLAVSPVRAEQNASILSIELKQMLCAVDIVFEIEDAGEYFVNAWDDGMFLAGDGGTFAAGSIVTVRYTIGGPTLEGAAGVGLYVQDGLGPAAVDRALPRRSRIVPSRGQP